MIIKLGLYRSNFNYIKTLYEQQKPEKIAPWVSLISVTTSIPVIVVYWYMGEIIGFTDEINTAISRLKGDYGYKTIEE